MCNSILRNSRGFEVIADVSGLFRYPISRDVLTYWVFFFFFLQKLVNRTVTTLVDLQ